MSVSPAGANDVGRATPNRRGIGDTARTEWPKKAADTVELVVDTIHDKAIRPLTLAARAIVFGLVVAAVSVVLLVLVAIAVVRVLDNYAFGHQVWASYCVVGGVFTLAGLVAWSRRVARPSASSGN